MSAPRTNVVGMDARLTVAGDSENPWWATGVITEARILRDEGKLEEYQIDVDPSRSLT